MAALDAAGVESRPFFVPVHKQPLYDRGLRLPVAEQLAETGLSLPSAVMLGRDEVERVVDAIAALPR
jgi:perosamine synthetase